MKFILNHKHLFIYLFAFAILPSFAASTRDVEAAKKAALGESADMHPPQRPARMSDLTKGEKLPPPGKDGPVTWSMGPAGIIGIQNGGEQGDQVQVISVMPGSPAEGKVLAGDVVLGAGGNNFVVGGHIGIATGNAIIKAEEEAGKGLFQIHIWRDLNWTKRNAAKDIFGVDIDKLFKEAAQGADLYDWKDKEEKTVAVEQVGFDEFPIDGVYSNVTIQLEVMGTYSDTSPWDCPVIKKVRANAWKVIANKFKNPDKRGRVRGSWPDVLALVASGKPEYIKLATQWVHNQKKLCQDMELEPSLDAMPYKGMQSWHHGFEALELAIYYDATGDKFVFPELRKRAILVALGQNGGGSWGHTFSFPASNGGLYHRNNPGYGAMNNAGTRCFFLLTLAKKAGIRHPEINVAIAKAARFFGTYVDKGCVPYGYHPPWPSDDSNGKNYGATYAFYVLGKKYESKYFSMHSAHASFTRRGGHGSPTLWYYTPLSANVAGPRGVQASMRNMRWFYTLSRNYDGSFIFLGDQAPGIGGKGMRNPTATVALHYSDPLKQLIITGKDADENFWMTDEEYNELMVSARGSRTRGQINDPVLLEQTGKPWNERETDDLLDLLDHFFPNMRRKLAHELGKRYAAGEKDIVDKVLPLLQSDEPRMRDGACLALSACGTDAVLAQLSKVVALLKDDAEFVRMTAATTIGKATEPGDRERELLMLNSVAEDYTPMSMDNGNVRSAIRNVLFPGGRNGSKESASKLTTEPFQAGFDEELVRNALEKIVTMDPGGMVPSAWNKETLLKLAGPITFSAEIRQVNDAMFGGARKQQAQALLNKYGYREAMEGDAANLRQRNTLERDMRMRVSFKDPNITPIIVKKAPGIYRDSLDYLNQWQQDNPIMVLYEKRGKGIPPILTPIDELIEIIEADKTSQAGPSVRSDVYQQFADELKNAGGKADQIKLCRSELADPQRRNYFRQMASLSKLVELLGTKEAIGDLLPYFGHEHWRVRKYIHGLGLEIIQAGHANELIAALKNADGENAAAILDILRDGKVKAAQKSAKMALTHKDPIVRRAAIQTVLALDGDKALPEIFNFMLKTDDPDDLWGCELVLLSHRDDPAFAKQVSEKSIALLPKATLPQRRSLAWVLAQLGGPESLAILQRAAEDTEDDGDLKEIVLALAFSPDRAADKILLTLAKIDKKRLSFVAAKSVHRMVGRNGVGDVTDTQRLDFAIPMLNMNPDRRLITYLGKVHTARSITTLLDVMKKGSTLVAAPSIIACAEGMENLPDTDAEIAADVLTEVIEFIEVTQLRGGVAGKDWRVYPMWKQYQARAGKALLRIYQPEKAPIGGFDDMDLDL